MAFVILCKYILDLQEQANTGQRPFGSLFSRLQVESPNEGWAAHAEKKTHNKIQ